LEDLVARRYSALLAYATLLTGNRAEAEDVVQEAIVTVFAKKTAFPSLRQAETYVRRTIASRFIDERRRRQRERARERRVHSDASRVTASSEAMSVLRLDVVAALATLPPRVRACVVLRYLADQSVSETAAALGLSEGAVKRYCSDGTAALNAALGTEDAANETVWVEPKGGVR